MEFFKEFKFDEDILFGFIFFSLKGIDFDVFIMKNMFMIWFGWDVLVFKKVGLWFEMDVEFCGLL